MTHFQTPDASQTVCTEFEEFDVKLSGETVAVGPQPTDYCQACGAVEPTWEILSEDEFMARYPL